MDTSPGEVTRLLDALRAGDDAAQDELARLVYDELHRRAAALMKRERPSHSLQPSDLVQEAFLRLLTRDDLKNPANRKHLMALMTLTMRRILVDHARRRDAAKHGGGWQRQPLDAFLDYFVEQNVDLVPLDEALDRLAEVHPRPCEVITLIYFGGFTQQEIADLLGVSVATVRNDAEFARAWLHRALRPQ